MDLDTLKRYSSGELTPKQFMAVHRQAGELLDLLQEHLRPNEFVSTVQDWPDPRNRHQARHFLVLKTMMLVTPLLIVGTTAFIFQDPVAVALALLSWLGLFGLVAVAMLWRRWRLQRLNPGQSVLVVTNRRMMRVWLDGSEEVQGWWLGDRSDDMPMEPVSGTIRFLLEMDLGEVSMN
ncbi:hypothetical protein HZB60_02505 [candidate division KSB1 bacterium]|nr:hypothetical protein [candidate division KSB1 bacterium]